MKNLERHIRELPRQGPSKALDGRIAALLEPSLRADSPRSALRPSLAMLAATALAAGLAGFAAGLGTGHWMTPPPAEPTVARQTARPLEPAGAMPAATLVRLTDARIGAGLDFSQSLEPFQVQPVDQEGS